MLQRAERVHAREQQQTPGTLSDLDFLLGVRDDLRQGALRFRSDDDGPFLSDDVGGFPRSPNSANCWISPVAKLANHSSLRN